MRSATRSQSWSASSEMPIQPWTPTYGGRKNRSGSPSTSACWAPGGALHQIPHRPACASWRMAKILSRTRHDGLPTPPPSVASGNDRQIRRMRSSIASPPASARRRLGAIVRRYAPDSVDRLRPLAAPFGRLERVREVVGLLRDLARIIGLQDRDEAD